MNILKQEYKTIVIGSGLAGLITALECKKAGSILLVTKEDLGEGSTRYAQGGIAVAKSIGDSIEKHLNDTVAAGVGLVDEDVARILVTEADSSIQLLEKYGVSFDSQNRGQEAAHSQARILHAGGDQTGLAISSALIESCKNHGIDILENTLVTDLIQNGYGEHVYGIKTMDNQNNVRRYQADTLVLATGGIGSLYSRTTNPNTITGDGISLAFEAGAELADLEFVQFHPTAFQKTGSPPFLLSETLRGEGATLRNTEGEAFMKRAHPQGDLAPRDIVAREITKEMQKKNSTQVWLDCTDIEKKKDLDLSKRFPNIFNFCKSQNIDLRTQPIPVTPAAHYHMGGIRTDIWGQTTVPNLYAVGEVAMVGVHGANRLASNSLLEAAVFGIRVAKHITTNKNAPPEITPEALEINTSPKAPLLMKPIQDLLWTGAGIERDGISIEKALTIRNSWDTIPSLETKKDISLYRASLTAHLILEAALSREESRGAHQRSDFPNIDDRKWRRHQVIRYVK